MQQKDLTVPPTKISFYVNNSTTFNEKIATEIQRLKDSKVRYVIFQDLDAPIPSMCCDGEFVSGLSNIKHELHRILR